MPESFSQLEMLEYVEINSGWNPCSFAFPLPLAKPKSHPVRVYFGFGVDSIPEAIAAFGTGVDSTLEPYCVFSISDCGKIKKLPAEIYKLKMELEMNGISKRFVDISALNRQTCSFRVNIYGDHIRYRRLARSLDDGHNITLIIYESKLPRSLRKLKKRDRIEIYCFRRRMSKHQKRRIQRFRQTNPYTSVLMHGN